MQGTSVNHRLQQPILLCRLHLWRPGLESKAADVPGVPTFSSRVAFRKGWVHLQMSISAWGAHGQGMGAVRWPSWAQRCQNPIPVKQIRQCPLLHLLLSHNQGFHRSGSPGCSRGSSKVQNRWSVGPKEMHHGLGGALGI